jgi:hypothetical protein
MAIPHSSEKFEVWVNETKQRIIARNHSNYNVTKAYSRERRMLSHYQSHEEFFAGELTGYTPQSNGSVLVDLWGLGDNIPIRKAIALVKAHYPKRTALLAETVEKQLALV